MSTDFTNEELRYLAGLYKTVWINEKDFLHGLSIARTARSRSQAEDNAARWFTAEWSGTSARRLARVNRSFYLAVGHLTKHRLAMGDSFSNVVMDLLLEVPVTFAEADGVLHFTYLELCAGALGLVKLYKQQEISFEEVGAAMAIAQAHTSVEVVERLAQRRLQDRLSPVGPAVLLHYSLCTTCLSALGDQYSKEIQSQELQKIRELLAKHEYETARAKTERETEIQTEYLIHDLMILAITAESPDKAMAKARDLLASTRQFSDQDVYDWSKAICTIAQIRSGAVDRTDADERKRRVRDGLTRVASLMQAGYKPFLAKGSNDDQLRITLGAGKGTFTLTVSKVTES